MAWESLERFGTLGKVRPVLASTVLLRCWVSMRAHGPLAVLCTDHALVKAQLQGVARWCAEDLAVWRRG